MVQEQKKTNVDPNLAIKAMKFCGKEEGKEFRSLSQMTDYALRYLIEKLEMREE